MRILAEAPAITKPADFVRDLTERLIDQEQRDLLLHRAGYTGASQDLVAENEWLVWVDGEIVGWAATMEDAQRRAAGCHAAQQRHVLDAVIEAEWAGMEVVN
jgi:hypothetical protein